MIGLWLMSSFLCTIGFAAEGGHKQLRLQENSEAKWKQVKQRIIYHPEEWEAA
jgi:hypothetical protein